jgi:HD superfamily phosphohydrolase
MGMSIAGRVKADSSLVREVLNHVTPEVITELRSLRTEVHALREVRKTEIQKMASLLANAWKQHPAPGTRKLLFDDPIWGQAVIDESLSLLFAHPLVQRLNYIRQLSFAYLAFPSATHSRMSHSLGVGRLVESALAAVFKNNVVYTEKGVESLDLNPKERHELTIKAKTVALLHDLGHAPFGHALDRFIGFLDPNQALPYPDKHYSAIYLTKYLDKAIPKYLHVDNLRAILGHELGSLTGWDTLISDLIDSSLDLDRVDFLARDAHMSGLFMGSNCAEALIERICPFRVDDQIYLTFDISCLPYVGDLLFARERMYVNCYEHPKKLAAERIFTRLVQNLVEQNQLTIDEVIMLTDEQILALLALSAVGSNENSSLLAALLQNIDYELVQEIGLDRGDNPAVGQWNRARDRAGMGRHVYVELPSQWEKEITLAAGMKGEESWHVLVLVPDHKTGTPPGIATRVIERIDGGYTAKSILKANQSLLNQLKYAGEPRRRIRVFADSRLTAEQRIAIKRAARDLLGGN